LALPGRAKSSSSRRIVSIFNANWVGLTPLRIALRNATEALNRCTTPFAGRRMDARVRDALAGRRVDQLAA